MDENLLQLIREFACDLAELFGDVVSPVKVAGDAAKIAFGISDRILLHKVKRFLEGMSSETRHKFARQLREDEAKRKKTVEHLLVTLNQMDDMEKADMIAKCFCAHLEEKISLETFKRLASAINAAFIGDLNRAISFAMKEELEPFLPGLVRAGLTEIYLQEGKGTSQWWNDRKTIARFRLNILGIIFHQVMTDKPITGTVS
jgi:hypothetical protein